MQDFQFENPMNYNDSSKNHTKKKRQQHVFDNTNEYLNFLHPGGVRTNDIRPIDVNDYTPLESFGVKQPPEETKRKSSVVAT